MPNDLRLDKQAQDKEILDKELRPQKTAVIILALLAILVIVAWVWQFNAQLNRPFAGEEKKTKATSTTIDLNLIDSDSDGLSDYDEINTYKTSPYLEDSDSDGLNDQQEITQGTNPNCPTGKVCNGAEETIIPSATSTIINELPLINDSLATTSSDGIVTPAILRQLLLENGYDQATLEKISDEDIMKSYQEAIKNQAETNAANPSLINQ